MTSDYGVFLGLDVGKGEHHAIGLDPAGTRLHDGALPNAEARLREVFDRLAQHGPILVVVDQPATVGALPVAVARACGHEVAYLPGLAMRRIADLYPGNADDEPAPTLLVRLPYGKDIMPHPGEFTYGLVPNIFRLLDAGYVVVWQDCRGTFGSAGEYTPMVDEPHDGADTVAWLCAQPWCNGTIGSYGHSYLGMVQWQTAAEQPEGPRRSRRR